MGGSLWHLQWSFLFWCLLFLLVLFFAGNAYTVDDTSADDDQVDGDQNSGKPEQNIADPIFLYNAVAGVVEKLHANKHV